jgi:HEAT repeat protein
LERLASAPFDEATLYSLEGQPEDPRTLPALRSVFEHATDKREKQWIASTILRLGDRSEEYFGYLAGYAKEATEDQSPPFAKYDSNGQGVRGQFSSEFLNWCTVNGKDPRTVASLQLGSYPDDILILARAEDPRALELFRRGLESPNPLVVAYSVQGLGRLHDTQALPIIVQAAERLRPAERFVISMNLPWYSQPEAFQLMARLTPDAKLRDHLTQEVQQHQLAEMIRAQSRQRKAPPQ